ncbi:MAG TPA: anti-sigma factor [Xanthobacteraceae bacterium]|jgi:anti-sigma factor RsiW|nr:anti-sigma factor [Xanthobacteraceae bacterium]
MVDRDASILEAELHGYVDGELPAERRAAVEAWLAAHPQDAARVAAWQAQADLINARYGGVAQEPIPPRLDVDRLARRERRWPLLAVAAVVAAFVLGGLAGWFARETWAGGAGGLRVFTADAIDAHKLYVVEVRHPVEVAGSEQAHLVQWLSKRLGYDVRAPDLGPIGLKLVGGRLLPGASGAGAALLMYEGPSGERFTIYCARSHAPETALRYQVAGAVAAFYWIDDSRGFVVSGPADRDRLLKIAQSVYDQENAPSEKKRG